MPSILGQQVDSFADQVLADHYEAMEVQDVVERMHLSTAFVEVVKESGAKIHELGGTFTEAEDAAVRRMFGRLLNVLPRVLGWARRKQAEGHPIEDRELDQFEESIRSVRECLDYHALIVAENTENPDLPSVDDLVGQIAAAATNGYEAATTNAMRLFGRPVL